MTVIWNYPTRIVFGEGAVAELPAETARLGCNRAFIVTDPGVTAAGLTQRVATTLKDANLSCHIFDSVGGNPTDDHLHAATEACRSAGADLIVGLGGGSAMDVAKLLRFTATHPPPLELYQEQNGGDTKITSALLPMVAIPTTAGTGSEVGRSGVVTMGEQPRKTIFFSPLLMPSVALLDPAMTVLLPPAITAATGFDALTHCIEAYLTRADHPMADAIALEGIRLVQGCLERAVHEGTDMDARGGMLKAAAFGAVAFQKGLGACHSLAHPLSTELAMHHGLANALCLPAVVNFNRPATTAKLARVAELLGVRAKDDSALALECPDAVRSFRSRVGLPDGLGAAGVKESLLEHLADLAFEDPCHLENPRSCERDQLLALYRESY